MYTETDNITEVVKEAIRTIPLDSTEAERLLLTMLHNDMQQTEVERVAERYNIESTELLCYLVNAGISITRSLLYLAVKKGIPPVHALAMLQNNTYVYKQLIHERDTAALLDLFEEIAEIAA